MKKISLLSAFFLALLFGQYCIAAVTYNVEDFGALGSDYIDDTQAVNAVINQAAYGDSIYFPSGKYIISSPIIVRKSGIKILGNSISKPIIKFKPTSDYSISYKAVLKNNITNLTIGTSCFVFLGSLDTANPMYLANDFLYQSTAAILKKPSNTINPGDIVIFSQKNYDRRDVNGKNIYFYREQNHIDELADVSGVNISTKNPLPIDFLVSNYAKLFKINPVKDITVKNLIIDIVNPADLSFTTSGISAAYLANSRIDNVKIVKYSHAGIYSSFGYSNLLQNNKISNSISVSSNMGLGIKLDRSHSNIIKNNTLKNMRHGIILNHGNGSNSVIYNIVDDSKVTGGIDLHGEFNFNNNIIGNIVKNSKTGIIVGGGGSYHYNDGPDNKVKNNNIINSKYGIQIRTATPYVYLKDNTFIDIVEERQIYYFD